MKTISAKELRTNLDSILERVNAGEEIIVKHRFREPVVLRSYSKKVTPKAGTLPGLAIFDRAPKKKLNLDPNKSLKQLYHEHLDEKHGR